VAFYHYFLRRLLADQPGVALGDIGAIWLKQPHTPVAESVETFLIGPWLELLEGELGSRIPRAFSLPLNKVAWQLRPSCQICPYWGDCRERGKTDVRGLPSIAPADSNFLSRLVDPDGTNPEGARPLTDLARVLQTAPEPLRLRAAAVLGRSEGDGDGGGDILQSFLENRPLLRRRPYGLFPRSQENLAVALTLAVDPVYHLPHGWGLAVELPAAVVEAGGPGVASLLHGMAPAPSPGLGPGSGGSSCYVQTDGVVFEAEPPGGEALGSRELECLMRLLARLRDVTAALEVEPFREMGTQFYVWDGKDRGDLTSMLLRVLHDGLVGDGGDVRGVTAEEVEHLALVLLDGRDHWLLKGDPPTPATEAQLKSAKSIEKMTVRELEATGALPPGTVGRGKKTAAQEQVKAEAQQRNTSIMLATPAVCELLPATAALVHLPSPGCYRASDVVRGVDEIEREGFERLWLLGGDVRPLLSARTTGLLQAKTWLRGVLGDQAPVLLYNDSQPRRLNAPAQRLPHPLLQRLSFMKQMDVIFRCTEARRKRAEASVSTQELIRLVHLKVSIPQYRRRHYTPPRSSIT
jgi:hypothetical protein